MGYIHIPNLYKVQDILLFKQCFALEKIHGTSARLSWNPEKGLRFFSGGAPYVNFLALFDQDALVEKFKNCFGQQKVVVYGEAYGGKCQGMSKTYGPDLRFVAFDVKIEDCWLCVPQAEKIVQELGLEFVAYNLIDTSLEGIDYQRDLPSIQSQRNGISGPQAREGVVLRPLIEVTKNNGERIIAKHKGIAFSETKTPREVSPEALKIIEDIQAAVDEWVTPMRLTHVMDKFPDLVLPEQTGLVLKAMVEDVLREGEGEIVNSREFCRAISKKTAQFLKQFQEKSLRESHEMALVENYHSF